MKIPATSMYPNLQAIVLRSLKFSKILMPVFFLVCASIVANAQSKVPPKKITTPDKSFLLQLQTDAKTLNPVGKKLSANEVAFINLVKTGTTAATWTKVQYKAFIKKATPLIKASGLHADPDDGGEIFGDPDDGGEVFSSSAMVSSYIKLIKAKLK